jgi:hypothetical protein
MVYSKRVTLVGHLRALTSGRLQETANRLEKPKRYAHEPIWMTGALTFPPLGQDRLTG